MLAVAPSGVTDLDALMDLKTAATRYSTIFTINELREAVRVGTLGHIRKANRTLVSEEHLKQYLQAMEVKPCQATPPTEDYSNSENTGSITSIRKSPEEISIDFGMTEEYEQIGAEALARKILNKRKKS